MPYDPQKHHRRSIRLRGYDYTQSGAYFVTICTYQKQCWFGDIRDGQMQLNQIGRIVAQEWMRSFQMRQEIDMDEWIIMPNHVHGIVVITDIVGGVRAQSLAPLQISQDESLPLYRQPRSLSSFVAGFKTAVTQRINAIRQAPGTPVWQRNFHENIIRNEESLQAIRQYIVNNPQRWSDDSENPTNHPNYQQFCLDLPF